MSEALFEKCPYGAVGDVLWCREAWAHVDAYDPEMAYLGDKNLVYRADTDRDPALITWKPSIHMPRWASRLTLEITDIRVERLQSISEEDICHELGCPVAWPGPGPEPYKRDLYGLWRYRWDQINGKRPGCTWTDDPWVFAISFQRVCHAPR